MVESNSLPKRGIELADVVRRFGPKYTTRYAGRMMPSQRRALADIAACSTEALGGRRYRCDDCRESFWHYHACRNRACPKCQGKRTEQWLNERQRCRIGRSLPEDSSIASQAMGWLVRSVVQTSIDRCMSHGVAKVLYCRWLRRFSGCRTGRPLSMGEQADAGCFGAGGGERERRWQEPAISLGNRARGFGGLVRGLCALCGRNSVKAGLRSCPTLGLKGDWWGLFWSTDGENSGLGAASSARGPGRGNGNSGMRCGGTWAAERRGPVCLMPRISEHSSNLVPDFCWS